jgi:hypothetical protein
VSVLSSEELVMAALGRNPSIGYSLRGARLIRFAVGGDRSTAT